MVQAVAGTAGLTAGPDTDALVRAIIEAQDQKVAALSPSAGRDQVDHAVWRSTASGPRCAIGAVSESLSP
jgi:hypothetical protein